MIRLLSLVCLAFLFSGCANYKLATLQKQFDMRNEIYIDECIKKFPTTSYEKQLCENESVNLSSLRTELFNQHREAALANQRFWNGIGNAGTNPLFIMGMSYLQPRSLTPTYNIRVQTHCFNYGNMITCQ